MFFATADGMRPAPLSHNPFNALVMPRPIAWISTVDAHGTANLAPYSYFNAVAAEPPYVMFAPNAVAPGAMKDTYRNLVAVPEFVVNLVCEADGEAMNATSKAYPHGVDEFEACGLARLPGTLVRPPRVASAKAALECRVYQTVHLPPHGGRENHVVIGEVVGIHIADDVITPQGLVDERLLAPLARLGYMNYGTLGDIFAMLRPD
jgi:flavin reductase (DIM6/NTAB) family NADH-FMN oxidoreductase RutF